jgi:hypothetical protein
MKMNRNMNEVEGFTFEGIIRLAEEKLGKKQTMEIVDVLYLHHLKSRGICGESEDDMKKYLMKEGNDSNKTLSMIKRYNSVKEDLFIYNWRTQSIMDRIQSYGDSKSITSWETIDGKVIGLVKENEGYKVVDISDGKERLLARINEGIFWVDTNLTPRQMNYITKNGRLLKSNNQMVL